VVRWLLGNLWFHQLRQQDQRFLPTQVTHLGWDHGPQTRLDWTRGCIALGTDAAIAIVSDWVKEHRPSVVHIY
jgi:hypothetical protein